MKRILSMCLAVMGAGLVACGGGKAADIQNNAPGYSSVSMDMEATDGSAPTTNTAALTPDGHCHPLLFLRSRHVVHRLNWHLYKVLFAIDHAIQHHPNATSGSTATWTRSGPRYTVEIKGTKDSETQYSYEVDFKATGAPDSAYVKAATAEVTVNGAEQKGTLHVDLSAYASVIKEDKSSGTIDYSFDISGDSKTIEATLSNFLPDDDLSDEISPRNAHYVFTRHKGVGGSLKYTDELILLCPDNPNNARATVDTVFRWTKTSTGVYTGRGDTQATGGQLPGGDKIEGVTCGELNATDVEKYWMMKAEDSSGKTITAGSFSYDSAPGVDPTAACNPAFGAVPTTADSSNDYDFTKVDFTSATPVDYPTQG